MTALQTLSQVSRPLSYAVSLTFLLQIVAERSIDSTLSHVNFFHHHCSRSTVSIAWRKTFRGWAPLMSVPCIVSSALVLPMKKPGSPADPGGYPIVINLLYPLEQFR